MQWSVQAFLLIKVNNGNQGTAMLFTHHNDNVQSLRKLANHATRYNF